MNHSAVKLVILGLMVIVGAIASFFYIVYFIVQGNGDYKWILNHYAYPSSWIFIALSAIYTLLDILGRRS